MTNFATMVNLARSYQRFDKNLQRDDKKGHFTNGDYNKHGKLGNNLFKVCQNSNEMTNEACR